MLKNRALANKGLNIIVYLEIWCRCWDSNPDYFLDMELIYAERNLNRFTFYKCPNQLDDSDKTWWK